MKAFKVLSLCAAACLLGACSSDDEAGQTAPASFQVEAAILNTPETRAPQLDSQGAGTFRPGDRNTLFLQQEGGQYLQPFDYTYGASYFWSDLKLPEGAKRCRISACYPEVKTGTPQNHKWDVTQAQPTADLLAAAPVAAEVGAPSVRLHFAHLMHRFAVVLKAEGNGVTEEQLAGAQISCRSFLPVAEVNLLEAKAIQASGSKTTLTRQGKQVEFLLPGQPVGDIEVMVQIGDRQKTCLLSSCVVNGQKLNELQSGKQFTLTFGVKPEEIFVLGQDIAGWGDQGSADDTIIF